MHKASQPVTITTGPIKVNKSIVPFEGQFICLGYHRVYATSLIYVLIFSFFFFIYQREPSPRNISAMFTNDSSARVSREIMVIPKLLFRVLLLPPLSIRMTGVLNEVR